MRGSTRSEDSHSHGVRAGAFSARATSVSLCARPMSLCESSKRQRGILCRGSVRVCRARATISREQGHPPGGHRYQVLQKPRARTRAHSLCLCLSLHASLSASHSHSPSPSHYLPVSGRVCRLRDENRLVIGLWKGKENRHRNAPCAAKRPSISPSSTPSYSPPPPRHSSPLFQVSFPHLINANLHLHNHITSPPPPSPQPHYFSCSSCSSPTSPRNQYLLYTSITEIPRISKSR